MESLSRLRRGTARAGSVTYGAGHGTMSPAAGGGPANDSRGGFIMKQKFAQAVRILTTPPVFFRTDVHAALCARAWLVCFAGTLSACDRVPVAAAGAGLSGVLSHPGASQRRQKDAAQSGAGVLRARLSDRLPCCRAGTTAQRWKRSFSERISSPAQRLPCARCCISRPAAIPGGCSGPIAALSIFINPWFLVGYVLLTPIIWSSIRLKRHTALQLLAGCVIPVLAMLICRAQFL